MNGREDFNRAVRRQQQGMDVLLSQNQKERTEEIRKKHAQGQALGENLQITVDGVEYEKFVYGFSPMDETVWVE